LTAKLLDLDLENKRLVEKCGKQEALKLPQIIGDLEKQNGQLKNELEKERRVTVLLQGNSFSISLNRFFNYRCPRSRG
jgi:hypothetical protein